MSDYTNKEMLEAIYEVRDRVTRIEAQLNRAEKVEDKVDLVSEKTNIVKDIADDALALGQQNRQMIESIQSNNRWAWGFVITAFLGLIAQFFGVGQ